MPQNSRNVWFNCIKPFLRLFIRRPKFVYLGEPVKEPSIILSNHVGASAPLAWELYFPEKFHFWATHEMTGNLKSVFTYLSEIFFYQKKQWNYKLSKIFSSVAAPFVSGFYHGLKPIPTYRDHRLRHTIHKSIETLKELKRNIIIFPENSSAGYFDKLDSFHGGFILLAEACLKKGLDLPIVVSYYRKKDHTLIIDKPIRFSELRKKISDRTELASAMCERTNELALMNIE